MSSSHDPGKVALVHQDREITFGEVAALGEEVCEAVRAHRLQRRVVGVRAERSPEFVARMVALWSAGAVPAILGDWGRERVREALETTRAAAVLEPDGLDLLEAAGDEGIIDEASHILFTSGTTGRPKAIVVGRAAFQAACSQFFEELPMDESDRVAFLSRPGHDPSLRELLAPWLTGAVLVIPDRRTATDPRLTAAWLAKNSITVLQAPPVLLQLVAGSSRLPVESLRLVCSVGARLTAATLRATARFAPRATIVNCYGTSETPQVVCMHRVPPGSEDPIPIGRALGHAAVRIEPSGGDASEGRLQVEAAACALGHADGTPLPAPGGWYDTGDLVRRSPDGTMYFLRRADRQVQVNGTRVELEEIEAVAAKVDGVAGAVATFVEDGGGVGSVRLIVVRGPATAVDGDELRRVLRDSLDPAVVPSSIDVRASWPEDGLKPSRPDAASNGHLENQENQIERVLHESAQAVLGQGRIDPDGGFFEAGFTSMSLMSFVSEVSVRLGTELSPVLVFQYPTLNSLAGHLREHLANPES